jgi:hypothetical protein
VVYATALHATPSSDSTQALFDHRDRYIYPVGPTTAWIVSMDGWFPFAALIKNLSHNFAGMLCTKDNLY